MMDLANKKILLSGGNGFLGKFVLKELKRQKIHSVTIPDSKKDDLRKLNNCLRVTRNIDLVIHLAGNVGGIGYNKKNPYDLFYDNLIMGTNLMEAARRNDVAKFVTVGTVSAYPKFAPIPFKEDDLWNGYPEETTAYYALAKKMHLVQGEAARKQFGFKAIFLLMVNLYGPGDHFDPERSHAVPALIKKIVDAKKANQNSIEIWGTGRASREFLYVEDAAKAIVAATKRYDKPEPVNIGAGFEITIRELAKKIAALSKFKGVINWDHSKPDGQLRRSLDVSRARQEFGFQAKTKFEAGLQKTIKWYLENSEK